MSPGIGTEGSLVASEFPARLGMLLTPDFKIGNQNEKGSFFSRIACAALARLTRSAGRAVQRMRPRSNSRAKSICALAGGLGVLEAGGVAGGAALVAALPAMSENRTLGFTLRAVLAD